MVFPEASSGCLISEANKSSYVRLLYLMLTAVVKSATLFGGGAICPHYTVKQKCCSLLIHASLLVLLVFLPGPTLCGIITMLCLRRVSVAL